MNDALNYYLHYLIQVSFKAIVLHYVVRQTTAKRIGFVLYSLVSARGEMYNRL